MRIKMRNLLNLTEQAPQPPQPAPVPAPSQPAADEEPSPEDLSMAPQGTTEAPSTEDPSEYDFTRDFRAFEDAKNKAEAAAKKKLLDGMNKRILGKKIVANASRGYGQPKTDYTIEKVKKVSVEFWYKDWVVIVSDDNDKKFFLTPGVNIKIEQASTAPAEPAQDTAPAPQGQPQTEPEQPSAPGTEEAPNAPAPAPAKSAQPPVAPPAASPGEEVPPTNGVPQGEPEQPEQQPEQPQVEPVVDPRKKKKQPPVAEVVAKVLNEFTSKPYVIKEGLNEIPSKGFKQPFDIRDFMLEVRGELRSRKLLGSVDIQKIGLNYQITVSK